MTIVLFLIIFSVIHSSLFNHWMPISILTKSYNFSFKKALLIFFIASVMHNLSTIIFAYLIGYLNILSLQKIENLSYLSTSILLIIGIYYLLTSKKKHQHNHKNFHDKSFILIFSGILLGMLLSPCIEISLIFLSFKDLNHYTLFYYAFIYFLSSTFTMFLFSSLAFLGFIGKPFNFLEKNMRKIVGITFILLGIFSFFGDPIVHKILNKIPHDFEHLLDIKHDHAQ